MKLRHAIKVSFEKDSIEDWRFHIHRDPYSRAVGWVFLCPSYDLGPDLSAEQMDTIGDQMFAAYYWNVMLDQPA